MINPNAKPVTRQTLVPNPPLANRRERKPRSWVCPGDIEPAWAEIWCHGQVVWATKWNTTIHHCSTSTHSTHMAPGKHTTPKHYSTKPALSTKTTRWPSSEWVPQHTFTWRWPASYHFDHTLALLSQQNRPQRQIASGDGYSSLLDEFVHTLRFWCL